MVNQLDRLYNFPGPEARYASKSNDICDLDGIFRYQLANPAIDIIECKVRIEEPFQALTGFIARCPTELVAFTYFLPSIVTSQIFR